MELSTRVSGSRLFHRRVDFRVPSSPPSRWCVILAPAAVPLTLRPPSPFLHLDTPGCRGSWYTRTAPNLPSQPVRAILNAEASLTLTTCATGCATDFALCRVETRYCTFLAKEKPVDLTGFGVKSLVALTSTKTATYIIHSNIFNAFNPEKLPPMLPPTRKNLRLTFMASFPATFAFAEPPKRCPAGEIKTRPQSGSGAITQHY